MAIVDALVLPADVVLVPASELPPELRRKLGSGPDDWAISRPGLRRPSMLLDSRSAELLALFRQPRTIVEAVVHASRSAGADPEAYLGDAFPMLERLIVAGFLVADGDQEVDGILPTLHAGDHFGKFEILTCVQALADLEVFQVRGPEGLAALKIERLARGTEIRQSDALPLEAQVLRHLNGSVAPRLVASGRLRGRRFLALEWFAGIDAASAAAEHRAAGDRNGQLSLVRAIARGYAQLHALGVMHGDVHTSNLLVGRHGDIRLVDFGFAQLARARRGAASIGRGGVGFFFEPEYACAALTGKPLPSLSAAGEQYALGALLYFLITGEHYVDFSLERQAMLRQIAEDPPSTFSARGVRAWPEMELVLDRCLRKQPAERYGAVAELATALEEIPPPRNSARSRRGVAALRATLTRTLARLDPEGPLFGRGIERPSASVNLGMAGIACGLYRIALAREDPKLLSAADLWAARAVSVGETEEGFYDPGNDLPREVVGRVSPYHAAPGPLAVQALVAHARGDPGQQHAATVAFAHRAREACENPDLTLGRSGALLTAAMLLDLCSGPAEGGAADLRDLGEHLLTGLWQDLEELIPITFQTRTNLGIAHGWAGYLYATLRWCRSAGRQPPPAVERRLSELAGCAVGWRRGSRWPWHGVPHQPWEIASMPGWCNGSAGFVHLWSLAVEQGFGAHYAELAESAAWNTWEIPAQGRDLCCGLAGRSYALLALHRNGHGEPRWLERAQFLAESAAREGAGDKERAHSLFRGELGVAVLAADLERPEGAVMPFFGDEEWISRRQELI
jgi:hypothetical protein